HRRMDSPQVDRETSVDVHPQVVVPDEREGGVRPPIVAEGRVQLRREPVVVIHPLVAEPEVVHREELGAPEAELRLPRLELEGEAEGLVHAVDVLVPLGEALPRVDRLRLGDREGRLALWTERGLDQAELTVPPEHLEVRVPSLSIA